MKVLDSQSRRTGRSKIASAPLHDLNLRAARIGDEEEPRDHLVARCEIDQLARRKSRRPQPGMLGIDIIDRYGDTAVTVTDVVRLCPAGIDRQFNLEIGFGVRQIDQGKAVNTRRPATFSPKAVP